MSLIQLRYDIPKRRVPSNFMLYSQVDKNNGSVNLIHGDNAYTVLICTTDDGTSVGK